MRGEGQVSAPAIPLKNVQSRCQLGSAKWALEEVKKVALDCGAWLYNWRQAAIVGPFSFRPFDGLNFDPKWFHAMNLVCQTSNVLPVVRLRYIH